MKTRIFFPPLRKHTGGTAVLVQLAEHLHAGGFDAALVLREEGGQGLIPEHLPVVPWDELQLAADDIWLVPEGWVNALTPGLNAGARSVLYVQNWAYLFSALPQGVHWRQLDVRFLSVSQPVAWFVAQAVGQESPVLRPGIDTQLFSAPEKKPAITSADPVRVAWMPRKNKALALQIRSVVESRRFLRGQGELAWEEIHGLDLKGVAEALGRSHVFLATGFPEGCPLPPLEAMACGCLCVGFSGLGGWDYMRQAQPQGFAPWWPLRDASEAPWSGNGLWVADADVMAAALSLEQAVAWLEQDDPKAADTVAQAGLTADSYALAAQKRAVLDLWRRAAAKDALA